MTEDMEQRLQAFKTQLEAWAAAERPGVPFLAMPDINPDPGSCVSCGEPRAQEELRCQSCLAAVTVVLASPVSRAIQAGAARLQALKTEPTA